MQLTHRYWTGNPHPLQVYIHNTVEAAAPGPVIEWTDDTLPGECLEECERAEGKVKEEDAIRHRCNVIRWWMLYHQGGYTCHHDLIPLKPFAELPYPVTAAHGVMRCTGFLGFPAGHEVPAQMLELIRLAPRSELPSPYVSGERVLSQIAPVDLPRLVYPLGNNGTRKPDSEFWAIFLRFPKERYRQNVGASRGI